MEYVNEPSLLLATVSHELRNPLHVIQGIAELLTLEQLPPRAAALASSLARQVHALASVTDDLLDATRPALSTARPTDLRRLVNEVAEFGRSLHAHREHGDVCVEATTDQQVPGWVTINSDRLRQVLRNLIGNAVKFTSSGSVHLHVTADHHLIRFSVSDTGIGIDADELVRVMEPFVTGVDAGAGRGEGLGLAIAQHLVNAMGGALTVESQRGVGTVVRFHLPLTPADAPGATVKSRPGSATVLVVEDDRVSQQLVRSQLERLGMRPVIASSGEAALALLSAEDCPAIDLIVMDLHLAGMNGVETCRRLRSISADLWSIPVVGLSASPKFRDVAWQESVGFDAVLIKPASLDDLRVTLDVSLNVRRIALPESDDPELVGRAKTKPLAEGLGPSVFDLAIVEQLVSEFEDRSLARRLVALYLDDLEQRGSQLIEGLRVGDRMLAAQHAHTLRAGARLVGAGQFAWLCARIESGSMLDPDLVVQARAQLGSALREWLDSTEPPG